MSPSNKIFIGNLDWSYTSESLKSDLENLGYAIEEAKVIKDRETGRSRGFAFVTFGSVSAANEARRDLDGMDLGGRPVRVSEAVDRNKGDSKPKSRESGTINRSDHPKRKDSLAPDSRLAFQPKCEADDDYEW